jgi:hypothetical protein
MTLSFYIQVLVSLSCNLQRGNGLHFYTLSITSCLGSYIKGFALAVDALSMLAISRRAVCAGRM